MILLHNFCVEYQVLSHLHIGFPFKIHLVTKFKNFHEMHFLQLIGTVGKVNFPDTYIIAKLTYSPLRFLLFNY